MRCAFIICFFLMACSSPSVAPVLDSRPAHHTDEGFINPYAPPKRGGLLGFFKMRYFGKETWPDFSEAGQKIARTALNPATLASPGDQPRLTWIGHATVLIQYRGINILTDPVLSQRASPVDWAGPKRYSPLPIALNELPPIDFVLLSHNHYDALDKESVRGLGNTPVWLVPLGHKQWFRHVGIAENNIHEFDWWDQRSFGAATITSTPAQHWSKRTLLDTDRALWSSWAVTIDDFSFWFAGDTGYNPVQFKQIGRRFKGFDVALIPIGAYAPRWFMKTAHINPEEAVTIQQEVKANRALGIHWGTFPLTAEPVDEPPNRLREALKRRGLPEATFEAWAIGESRSFPW